MKLAELLTVNGKSVEDITQIYHGKNKWCRCGCGGKYFEKGERGFTRALNAMQKESFVAGDYEPVEFGSTYVNIPEGEEYQNKAYCLYFD